MDVVIRQHLLEVCQLDQALLAALHLGLEGLRQGFGLDDVDAVDLACG